MKKYNILLDLDQTLIASEALSEMSKSAIDRYGKKFDYHIFPGQYVIFARPHLQSFLDFLFANFNVSVWTAASKEYALFIIEKFILTKPDRKLDFFFYLYHTKMSMKNSSKIKDLSMLWDMFELKHYTPRNTYIIDDNSQVYDAQPKNTIRIKAFDYDAEDASRDSELQRIRLFLEKIQN